MKTKTIFDHRREHTKTKVFSEFRLLSENHLCLSITNHMSFQLLKIKSRSMKLKLIWILKVWKISKNKIWKFKYSKYVYVYREENFYGSQMSLTGS